MLPQDTLLKLWVKLKKHKITQKKVAERAKVTAPAVSQFFNGDINSPDIHDTVLIMIDEIENESGILDDDV